MFAIIHVQFSFFDDSFFECEYLEEFKFIHVSLFYQAITSLRLAVQALRCIAFFIKNDTFLTQTFVRNN